VHLPGRAMRNFGRDADEGVAVARTLAGGFLAQYLGAGLAQVGIFVVAGIVVELSGVSTLALALYFLNAEATLNVE
jgi:hypothetical protein